MIVYVAYQIGDIVYRCNNSVRVTPHIIKKIRVQQSEFGAWETHYQLSVSLINKTCGEWIPRDQITTSRTVAMRKLIKNRKLKALYGAKVLRH
jgi:hypothetical protein